MLNALMRLKQRYSFEIDLLDVDLDSALVERYDEMVPVLTASFGHPEEIYLCHYHFDHDRVTNFLENPSPLP